MEKKLLTIALDGPAASGKSTMGERIAKSMGFIYLDTGVMYRAVTLAALNKQVDVNDENKVTEVAETMDLEIKPASVDDGRSNDIFLEREDVTWSIRLPAVEAHVSQVSAYQGVRTAMTKKQREIGAKGGVVMVGRDIGTVVLPDADIKIYLDASVEERARRRHLELINRGKESNYEFVLEDLKRRDKIDSSRAIAPLKPADDAIIMDSDNLSIEQVYEKMMNIITNQTDIT